MLPPVSGGLGVRVDAAYLVAARLRFGHELREAPNEGRDLSSPLSAGASASPSFACIAIATCFCVSSARFARALQGELGARHRGLGASASAREAFPAATWVFASRR